jgi:phosphoribosylpyrophosphate synthetase
MILLFLVLFYSILMELSAIKSAGVIGHPHILNLRGGIDEYGETYESTKRRKYQVIAAPGMEMLAGEIVALEPERFVYHRTSWAKFPDGTDRIEVGGFQPVNRMSGQHVLFLCFFNDNAVTLSQFSVMITLLQSFVDSLTIVLPFYPVGTMDRVITEGQVATANTYAEMFSNLPSCGRPVRVVVYDVHTLQNRFYLHNHAFANLQTTVPLLLDAMAKHKKEHPEEAVDCVAFPDDGAAKRFGGMFSGLGMEVVTCGKMRDGEKRVINIQEGNPRGRRVIVVDDLVQTGDTLFECGQALRAAGAISVEAFVAHGVFPNDSWQHFKTGGERCCFDRFYITDSIPSITQNLPKDDVFVVLSLKQKIIDDLDYFSY